MVLALQLALSAAAARAATFTVNSTGDAGDTAPGDGVCNIGNGQCTLRAAIEEANAAADADTVTFNLGGGVPSIAVGSTSGLPLPVITNPLLINGAAGPSVPATRVELNGTNAGAAANGLRVAASGCTVQNLVINRFNGNGIQINASGTVIKGNFIGLDATGTIESPNGGDGVVIEGSANNTIGGITAADRNVLSGNGAVGIRIHGSGATGNRVQGNYIGVGADGASGVSNASDGVVIDGAPGNTIGGTTTSTRNVISGNDGTGVVITGSAASGNVVAANFIGTDPSGGDSIANLNDGVLIDGAPGNTVGGTVSSARNIISGNTDAGVHIRGATATGNLVQGNYLGPDPSGTVAVGNGAAGVEIDDAPANTIGGASANARNTISGNDKDGVSISGAGATGNLVSANYIGLTAGGSSLLGNTMAGVRITDAATNTIGGTASAARNTISGNRRAGVHIEGRDATGNVVLGNFIGTSPSGSGALGNEAEGVLITAEASGNTAGGTAAGAANLIGGNGNGGIRLSLFATGNLIQGNFIGTNNANAANLGNSDGVSINTATNNTVGGSTSAARNIISGNDGFGVALTGGANANVLQGNFIGTNAAGTAALGNGLDGIFLSDSSGTTIGGAAPGNVIAFNGRIGVRVLSGTANAIRANAIYANAGLGIDLGPSGVTDNDPQDLDTGANNLQDFPVLSSVTAGASSTTIEGSLDSTPSTPGFSIEFFSNAACDASGYGEGQAFLGAITVATDGTGSAPFNATLPVAVAGGQAITATATDPANNTSEFSACVAVPIPAASATPTHTATSTPTEAATPTATTTPTATRTATAGPSSSVTPTQTNIPSTPTPTRTVTPTPSTTITPTRSSTRTATLTPTRTPTPILGTTTATPSPTGTPTQSSTRTATLTPTRTPTPIPGTTTATPSATPTAVSPTATRTQTLTPSPSPSLRVSPTPTGTPTRTPTPGSLPGDANCDQRVTAADLPSLVKRLMTHDPGPCGGADVNQDGSVDERDIAGLITALFGR